MSHHGVYMLAKSRVVNRSRLVKNHMIFARLCPLWIFVKSHVPYHSVAMQGVITFRNGMFTQLLLAMLAIPYEGGYVKDMSCRISSSADGGNHHPVSKDSNLRRTMDVINCTLTTLDTCLYRTP